MHGSILWLILFRVSIEWARPGESNLGCGSATPPCYGGGAIVLRAHEEDVIEMLRLALRAGTATASSY